MPGTNCGAGRDAEPCLPAVLAEKGGLNGSLTAAVEDGRYRTVERNGRGAGVPSRRVSQTRCDLCF